MEWTILTNTHRNPPYLWLDFILDEQVVGSAKVLVRLEMAIIKFIKVSSEHQRQGVGRRLVEFLQQQYPVLLALDVKRDARDFWINTAFAPLDQSQKDYFWANADTPLNCERLPAELAAFKKAFEQKRVPNLSNQPYGKTS